MGRNTRTRSLALALFTLGGCASFEGSPDSPGWDGCCEDADEAGGQADDSVGAPRTWIEADAGVPIRSAVLARSAVVDVDTGELIESRCPDLGFRRVSAVPGQRLRVELWEEDVRAQTARVVGDDFWCSDEPTIHRELRPVEFGAECWRLAPWTDAARVIWWNAAAEQGSTDAPDELAEFSPGQGLRVWLEVLATGGVGLDSSGACDSPGSLTVLAIACGPETPCSDPPLCFDGTCGWQLCGAGQPPCPAGQQCDGFDRCQATEAL